MTFTSLPDMAGEGFFHCRHNGLLLFNFESADCAVVRSLPLHAEKKRLKQTPTKKETEVSLLSTDNLSLFIIQT